MTLTIDAMPIDRYPGGAERAEEGAEDQRSFKLGWSLCFNDEVIRYLYRASHVYILLVSLVHRLLATYLREASALRRLRLRRFRKRAFRPRSGAGHRGQRLCGLLAQGYRGFGKTGEG